MPKEYCSCGFSSAEDEELIDHLLKVFSPADGNGSDGQPHDEANPALTCLCGFAAANPGELDAHFLRVFTPADSIASDGAKHIPLP